MKPGQIVLGITAVLGLGALAFSFLTNSSPYVSIAEAKAKTGARVHVVGVLVENSISHNVASQELLFELVDEAGDQVKVVYSGAKPNSMEESDKIVAIGMVQGEVFEAEDLIVKCPSKYESTYEDEQPAQ
jgi:cytochrome c-type biogenesis protein CcmE